MKKAEMIEVLANETGLSKADSTKALNSIFEIIKRELENGNDVAISDFGTFKISERSEREGRNPATGEKIKIAASKKVSFKAGSKLKDTINK